MKNNPVVFMYKLAVTNMSSASKHSFGNNFRLLAQRL